MDELYGTLITLAVVFKLLAWAMLLVAGLLAIKQLIMTPGSMERVTNFVLSLVQGGVLFVLTLAIGECIQVFLAIEENTRRGSEKIEQSQPKA